MVRCLVGPLLLAPLMLAGVSGCTGRRDEGADAEMIRRLATAAPGAPAPRAYPYRAGRLVFPRDEGGHSVFEMPPTLVEWYALYAHLAAGDGSRYLLFTTFVTFDSIEPVLGGHFPHVISTLVDVTNHATYHRHSMDRLKLFAAGHVEAETAKGDFFRWRGKDKPFEYDFHVAWSGEGADWSADLGLEMVKPPLVLGGTGYVRLPSVDSGYYSQTRVKAAGKLRLAGVEKEVAGVVWVDRQWLGVPFSDGAPYTYDWWGLQLAGGEEAIMFRIWDARTKKVAAARLEISRADGKREGVEEFTLADTPAGWRVVAPKPRWDLEIVRASQGHKPGEEATKTFLDAKWYSCDVKGTAGGKRVRGVAVAELVPKVLPDLPGAK